MSNIPYQLAIGVSTPTTTTTVTTRTNIIQNPSFEVDLSNWTWLISGLSVTRVASGLVGTHCMQIQTTNTSTSLNVVGTSGTLATATAGATYTGSASVRNTGGFTRDVGIQLDFFDISNNYISSSALSTANVVSGAGWVGFSVTGVAPAGTEFVNVRIYAQLNNAASGNFLLVDAVMIEEAPTVAPYFDGSTTSVPPTVYSWLGAAGVSPSQAVTTIVVSTSTAPTQGLDDFDSWELSRNLDDGCTLSIQLAGNSISGVAIKELETDIWVYRNGVAVDRFRVVSVDREWSDSGEVRMAVQAVCYRRIFASRHVITPLTFTGVSQGDIVWGLIQHTQAQTNGDLAITLNTTGAAVLRDRTYAPGQNILEAITDLAQSDGEMTWDIDANLELTVGTVNDYPLRAQPAELGTNLRAVSKPSGASLFGNVALVSGDTQFTVLEIEPAVTLSTDPRGRWEKFKAYSQEQTQTNLAEQARGILETTQSPSITWSFELIPDRFFGDSAYEIGDFVRLVQPATVVPSQPDPTIPYLTVPSASILVQILTVVLGVDSNGGAVVRMTAVQAPQPWNALPSALTWDSIDTNITWNDMTFTYLT